MAVYNISPQRIGQLASHARRALGSIDKGIRFTGAVFHHTKHLVPNSKMKAAAERGLSDYAAVREKVRNATLDP